MTPDSGCYSTTCLSTSQSTNFNNDLQLDINGSYIKYINTFALQDNSDQSINSHNFCENHQLNVPFISTDKEQLNKLNVYQLNELIEQIENGPIESGLIMPNVKQCMQLINRAWYRVSENSIINFCY